MKTNRLTFLLTVVLFTNILFPSVVFSATEVVLKEKVGWTIDSISPGLIRYEYDTYYRPYQSQQIVNVLEIDISNPKYNFQVKYASPSDSLSSVAIKANAIAGINGSYELDATFVRTENILRSQVVLPSSHLRFWKHEGAFFYNETSKVAAIEYGTNSSYFNSSFPNVLSGAPMLIDDFSPVGETFVGDISGINLNSLDYEDYRRHQGVRHPRTAVALTEGNKLLLIVVDGRRTNYCEGMSAKELTQFLVRYFNPKHALNIDGGGSSTMYIKGSSESSTGVVNYPTDNGKFDHYGQRSVRTFILVKEVSDGGRYAGGSGTEQDPYIITDINHLNNIRTTDWDEAVNNKPYFKLENDIDLSGVAWTPINNSSPYAQLHFDGNGHVIRNMSVKEVSYASLFGVLCGSCKNLGVIDADVESTSGAGIITAYVGIKSPATAVHTGIIENCYTTGKVVGSDAVGGIFGNMGKPDSATGVPSVVRNCYSTATITARNTTNKSRAGGVGGIIFDGGVLENCYSTGTVKSLGGGATGGIVGWTDSTVKGVVAINESITNSISGNIGRVGGNMGSVGGVQAQGENCWGYIGTILDNAGTILTEGDMVQGEVATRDTPYDGETKPLTFLSDPMNYFQELGWDFASVDNIWAQTMSNGKPIFQWLFARGDYGDIDGHGSATSMKWQSETSVQVFVENGQLEVRGESDIKQIRVYTSIGQLISQHAENKPIVLGEKGLYIVCVETAKGIVSKKVLNY